MSRLLRKIQFRYELLRRLERPGWRDFFAGNIVRWLLFLNVVVLLGVLAAIAYFVRPTEYPLILRYSVFFGMESDSLGPWYRIYYFPAFGAATFLLNTVLAYFSYHYRERIAAYILLLGAFLVQCAVAVSVSAIILINA